MSKRILIVDDSTEQLEITKKYLEANYQVTCMSSGLDALRYLLKEVPDLIFLDIDMPYMDGVETLKRIRAMEAAQQVPVVGLTGDTSKKVILGFISSGGNGCLGKPIQRDELVAQAEKYLSIQEKKSIERKILAIDDEVESLYIIKSFLQDQYNVVTIKSVKFALEYLQRNVPDLILLDYQMDLFNGASLYKMIKKMDKLQDVPIAFVTGTKDREKIMECVGLEPIDIIIKPLKKEVLLDKINDIFDKHIRTRFDNALNNK